MNELSSDYSHYVDSLKLMAKRQLSRNSVEELLEELDEMEGELAREARTTADTGGGADILLKIVPLLTRLVNELRSLHDAEVSTLSPHFQEHFRETLHEVIFLFDEIIGDKKFSDHLEDISGILEDLDENTSVEGLRANIRGIKDEISLRYAKHLGLSEHFLKAQKTLTKCETILRQKSREGKKVVGGAGAELIAMHLRSASRSFRKVQSDEGKYEIAVKKIPKIIATLQEIHNEVGNVARRIISAQISLVVNKIHHRMNDMFGKDDHYTAARALLRKALGASSPTKSGDHDDTRKALVGAIAELGKIE